MPRVENNEREPGGAIGCVVAVIQAAVLSLLPAAILWGIVRLVQRLI